MLYSNLSKTDIKVSKICLGTMTFGEQNTEEEGHQQIDYALDQGVNFIDTAEMYSVPGRKETSGSTERIIGTWFKKNASKRQDLILATKVTGPMPALSYISPNMGFSKDRILEAIDGSLKRLQTDYIDIYQLHWPERKTNFFGTLGYVTHDENWKDNFEEALSTLDQLTKEGKIRHWGLSNETPWGVMRTSSISEKNGFNKAVSIQNPYSLLNRTYEIGLSEISMREHIGLLAYSPLGFGRLTGKFENGTDSPNDRINKFKNLARYNNDLCITATKEYMKIADEAGLSITQMALAFVNTRPFVYSNIIGATNMDQLKENIDSVNVDLSADTLAAIEKIHHIIQNPAP
jgi:aryl-alcohol dehydrogenase-like predicted oxidoreductase